MSGNITKPKVFEGYTAIVDDIDKLPVYSFNDEIYTVIGEVEKHSLPNLSTHTGIVIFSNEEQP